MPDAKIGESTTKPLECIRWKSKYGAATHYCFANPGKDCPPLGYGCKFSQFKPVYHRMLNKKERGLKDILVRM